MARVVNTAEGQAHNTTVSTGNSGGTSGNAFGLVSIGSGGAAIFSSDWSAFGDRSYRCSGPNTGTAILGWVGYNTDAFSFRCYFRLASLPSATVQFCQIRHASGNAAYVLFQASGGVQISNAANSTTNLSGVTLAAETDYIFEFAAQRGSTTENGTILCQIRNGSTGAVIGTPYSNSAQNTGTGDLTNVRFGKVNSGNDIDVFIDQLALDDGTTALIGPYIEPDEPPTLEFSASPKFVVDARDSTPGTGDTLTFTLEHVSGPDHSGEVEQIVPGLFLIPQDVALAAVYELTAIDGDLETSDEAVVIPIVSGGTSLRRRAYNGEVWV